MKSYDYLIVGGGIIGLSIARELINRFPKASICILEKESDVAHHSSGRNSGVLHAGFYYTANSLKARFTREGNQEMTSYCDENGLKINKCGKLVVATDETELEGLNELKKRAEKNGVELHWINEPEVHLIDPNVKTFKKALYSPTTASVNPVEVCQTIKAEVLSKGVDLICNTQYKGRSQNEILTNNGIFTCNYFINAAGLYADKVARDFDFGDKYTIIPFKGIYLKYAKNKSDVTTNIYPVPNLKNPFLGVHFTKTVDESIKIGPTAIPAFWRENYSGLKNFKLNEFFSILLYEAKLFMKNSFNFRSLAFEEMKKYKKSNFIKLSLAMVKNIDKNGFGQFMKPGIRAQLLNKETLELVQDFVDEGDNHSFHILNAVSPGFTCAFPFSRYVVDKIQEKQGKKLREIKENIS
ncbi:FAD-dependent oxidoreductase [Virgibacillus profundi]|uniref:FAD-dependent oxidoreductase n=1 Tax=Virgibacillus profundi TaxID=2024555 RepID=A0A2A2IK86_9BACI|nr:L-2-hydroxyglutarate oxidase [Virgibacillus profundi]PAV31533.1 FAD-dependent oxidoreductase [Virgibacillus profundi]PXY55719.1 L-2-hydroxyglutarate oxidase [Virgibacillus profundi]